MILEIIIGILGLIVAILGYATFNLLQKNEKAEDIIVSYQEFINNLSEEINKSDKRLEQIDQRGIFKSDDEIGFMYEQIKELQRILSNFRVDKL